MSLFKKKEVKEIQQATNLYYVVGVESANGSLLGTKEFKNDRETFKYISDTIREYGKCDLAGARYIIQIYPDEAHKDWADCISQIIFTEKMSKDKDGNEGICFEASGMFDEDVLGKKVKEEDRK